jgi:alkanesulfonate monooxygenase SsuD/methylene tetrahydromethanopterin reductase-like flavin-dependent oxidoreductase (luciferase family)
MGVEKGDAPAILEESVELMRQLWTSESVTFDGAHYRLRGIAVEPKPHRDGGPPIWLGGFSPLQTSIWQDRITESARRGLQRVGRMADTWIPLLYSTRYARSIAAGVLADSFAEINATAEAHGRGSRAVSFAFSHWYYVIENKQDEADAQRDLAHFFPGSFEEAKETYLIGSPGEIVDKVNRICAKIGEPGWYVFTQLGNNERQLDLLHGTILPKLGISR